jgi:hypothetical protein
LWACGENKVGTAAKLLAQQAASAEQQVLNEPRLNTPLAAPVADNSSTKWN